MTVDADVVVLGAGIFGSYGALVARRAGLRVVLVSTDASPFSRASHANQARVHLGYHYPRSLGTALQAASYYERFTAEFSDCLASPFDQLYAISRSDSYTSAEAFERFCRHAGMPAEPIDARELFVPGSIVSAWRCRETGVDPIRLRDALWSRLQGDAGFSACFRSRPVTATAEGDCYVVTLDDGRRLRAPRVLNATYAAVNDVLNLFGQPPLDVSYELCEVVLGTPPARLADVGVTVLDGPFLSVMPYGRTGLHSLTAVAFTPRLVSAGPFPSFPCQSHRSDCDERHLADCATCPVHPPSGARDMIQIGSRYLSGFSEFRTAGSLYAVKTILRTSAVDDARPTLVLRAPEGPELVTILSGKMNTFYDLDTLW